MNWLAQFAAKVLELIAVPILDWVYSKIEDALARAEQARKNAAENKAAKENLLKAKTKEEKDAAARDLIDKL